MEIFRAVVRQLSTADLNMVYFIVTEAIKLGIWHKNVVIRLML